MTERIRLTAKVPEDYVKERVDTVAADLFPQYSRAMLQGWIKSGELQIDGCQVKASKKLLGGESLSIDAELENLEIVAEQIPLDVVFEDESILVLNKSDDLVVHPGAGNHTGTIMNGLLYYHEPLTRVPRAGIVHRLDKDTTGLMVVAKTIQSYNVLVALLSSRKVKRNYEAIVQGLPPVSGTIDEPIGRHHNNRTKMAVSPRGKEAVTHFRVIDHFTQFSHIAVSLETGRTHQIRVHMQHLGFPLIGDPVYGRRLPRRDDLPSVTSFPRQALHAKSLAFTHPESNKGMSFTQPLPEDMELLLDDLHINDV